MEHTYTLTYRALARILKLPIILERMPIKKVDAAKETKVERTLRAIMGGVQGPTLGPLVRSKGNTPVGVHWCRGKSPQKLWSFTYFECLRKALLGPLLTPCKYAYFR